MPTRRTLRGVAHNIATSFASTKNWVDSDYVMGHIVKAAWQPGATELHANLLTGTTQSTPLLVPAVSKSVAFYAKDFPDLVQRSQSDLSYVAAAELTITVDPNRKRLSRLAQLMESPFTCTAKIVDDRGKCPNMPFPVGGSPRLYRDTPSSGVGRTPR